MVQALASSTLMRTGTQLSRHTSSPRMQNRQPLMVQSFISDGRFGPQQRRRSGQQPGACGPQGFGMGMNAGPMGFQINGADVQRMMQELERAVSGFTAAPSRGRGEPAQNSSPAASGLSFPVDVAEKTDRYTFTADLPGVSKSDTKVQANKEQRVLTISGQRAAPQPSEADRNQRSRTERRFGQFKRTFKLPDDADLSSIRATFADGVLAVTIKRTKPAEPDVTDVPIDDWLAGGQQA